jgi:4-amino-4-deoxy-L-arabinose transferase-like glycosyltransferase
MLEKTKLWVARHPYWALAILTFAALFPFLTKPFNVDDPLFLWAAKQIQLHPGNPYGFNVNWYGYEQSMSAVTQNPPLTSYYLALVAQIFGWNEIGLHLAFMLPAMAAVLGTYRLAKSFCTLPLFAALLTLFTPAFLVSSTTIMCDVPLLAFWVWATVFWVEGMEQDDWRRLLAAGLLASLAFLTKYYGVCLIPLLGAYTFLQKRSCWRWGGFLLIPLGTALAYQLATRALYGQGMLSGAAKYAMHTKGWRGVFEEIISFTPLVFTGGCMLTATVFTPLMWRLRTLILFIAGAVLAAILYYKNGALLNRFHDMDPAYKWPVEIQTIFWAAGGIGILALAGVEVVRRRDAKSWLLTFWIFGCFSFSAFFNWTVNGRSILPMAPALAILITRCLEQKSLVLTPVTKVLVMVCAVLTLLVTRADFLLAIAVRQSAQQAHVVCGSPPGTVWFEGHWGFQYYMESFAAKPMDFHQPELIKSGDLLVEPMENSNVVLPTPANSDLLEVFAISGPSRLATWNFEIGAGFDASFGGPLPFAFGEVEPEKTIVYRLRSSPPPDN